MRLRKSPRILPHADGRGQKRDVVGQRAHVAGVVGQPFEFEGNRAQPLRAQRSFRPGEGLHDGRVGSGVGDGGVARHRFHLAHRRAMRAAGQRLLNAAMLIAERDFQVQHFFARALETEMARFDDARMDRADRDFVNLATVHAEKFAVGGRVAIPCAARV